MSTHDLQEQLRRAIESAERERQRAENERKRAEDADQRAKSERQRAERRAKNELKMQRSTSGKQLLLNILIFAIPIFSDQYLFKPINLSQPKEMLQVQKANYAQIDFVHGSIFFRPKNIHKSDFNRHIQIIIASEGDLANLQRATIETPVASIIGHLQSLDSVQDEFNIGDGIFFDNHPNTLSDTAEEVSQRLKNLQPFTPTRSTPLFSGLRADQICVYTTAENKDTLRKLAFVVEYKAPHKLNLASLRSGLREMDIKSVIDCSLVPPAKVQGIDNPEHFQYHADRLVASAITQTFSYMIQGGTQYAYITTGEAFVFLHVPLDDPGTIYYHLVEPGNDVLAQTEAGQEFVHRTAISQILAFTLLALESEAGNQKWIEDTMNMLDIWEVDYEAILHNMPDSVRTAPPSSEYRPKTYIPARLFAMNLRNRSANSTCRPDTSPLDNDNPESPDASDHESPPDTPTRPTNRKRHNQVRKDGSKNAKCFSIWNSKTIFLDLRVPNIFWNAEVNRVMLIDFERSEVMLDLRKGAIPSPNRERRKKQWLLPEKQAELSKKSDDGSTMLKSQVRLRFANEISIAQRELTGR
ncbi:hypothetical protein DID88_003747 [Monilinia fructigena]|uniref:Protein kinase domain-containing protein n=1 Tax=Monilinia fructigena TaxID=38457 RepID=A0A395ITS5_9HELO|nr:hypothetical protein DID88_003747 [Monilinia fructigena]